MKKNLTGPYFLALETQHSTKGRVAARTRHSRAQTTGTNTHHTYTHTQRSAHTATTAVYTAERHKNIRRSLLW